MRHGRKTRKIKASTRHGYTNEYLSPYGGLLPLVKLWDGLKFESLFSKLYCEPSRETQYGSLFFIKGLLVTTVYRVLPVESFCLCV